MTTTDDVRDIATAAAALRSRAAARGLSSSTSIHRVPNRAFAALAQYPIRLSDAWYGSLEVLGQHVLLFADDPADVEVLDGKSQLAKADLALLDAGGAL